MSNLMQADVRLINTGIKFASTVNGREEIITDYVPPLGEGENYTPLELFLVSLCTCAGGTVAPLLRKMGKEVSGLAIHASGERRETHPTGYTHIALAFTLTSANTTREELLHAIELTEQRFCPVWDMIKNNVEVTAEAQVILPE